MKGRSKRGRIKNVTYKADVGNYTVNTTLNGSNITLSIGASIKQYASNHGKMPTHVSVL
jgi:hypothetical protein